MHDFSPAEVRPGALHFAGGASDDQQSFGGVDPERAPLPLLRSATSASAGISAEPAAGSATEPASSSAARGRSGRTIRPNPLKKPMSKTV
jgi:hypothetical protein